jgi:hypothetical protein
MTQRKKSKTEIPDSEIPENEIHVPPAEPPRTLAEIRAYRDSLPDSLKRKRPPGPLASSNVSEYLRSTERMRDAEPPLSTPNRKPILKPLPLLKPVDEGHDSDDE